MVAGHPPDHVQAIQKTRLRRQEVTVEQAVVIHARRRKRITDEGYGFAVILLGHESAVIDRLAGEVAVREFEFVPALLCSVLHYLHSVTGSPRESGRTIRLGAP